MGNFIKVRIVNAGGDHGPQCHAGWNVGGLWQIGDRGPGGGP